MQINYAGADGAGGQDGADADYDGGGDELSPAQPGTGGGDGSSESVTFDFASILGTPDPVTLFSGGYFQVRASGGNAGWGGSGGNDFGGGSGGNGGNAGAAGSASLALSDVRYSDAAGYGPNKTDEFDSFATGGTGGMGGLPGEGPGAYGGYGSAAGAASAAITYSTITFTGTVGRPTLILAAEAIGGGGASGFSPTNQGIIYDAGGATALVSNVGITTGAADDVVRIAAIARAGSLDANFDAASSGRAGTAAATFSDSVISTGKGNDLVELMLAAEPGQAFSGGVANGSSSLSLYDDRISLGSGDDVLSIDLIAQARGVKPASSLIGIGRDDFDGGSGHDIVVFGNDGVLVGQASAGDTAQFDSTINLAKFHFKNFEEFEGSQAADTIRGATQDETIDGEGGNDRLSGGDGNDSLHGGAGADRLDGGSGADLIAGGTGKDLLTGGAGADVFYFQDGDKGAKVTDFVAKQGDEFRILSDHAQSFDDLTIKDDGHGGSLVSWKTGGFDVLDVAPSKLTAAAFVVGPGAAHPSADHPVMPGAPPAHLPLGEHLALA